MRLLLSSDSMIVVKKKEWVSEWVRQRQRRTDRRTEREREKKRGSTEHRTIARPTTEHSPSQVAVRADRHQRNRRRKKQTRERGKRRNREREETRTRDNARCVSRSNERTTLRERVLHSTRAIALLRSGRRGGAAVALELSRTERHRWRGRATRGSRVGEAEPKPRRKERRKGAGSRTRIERWGATWAPDARCPRNTTWDSPYLALPCLPMPEPCSRRIATPAALENPFVFFAPPSLPPSFFFFLFFFFSRFPQLSRFFCQCTVVVAAFRRLEIRNIRSYIDSQEFRVKFLNSFPGWEKIN